MKKLTTLLTICALCTGSLFAQGLKPLKARQVNRTVSVEDVFAPQRYKLAVKPNVSRMLANAPADAIIWEDFAKFTEGLQQVINYINREQGEYSKENQEEKNEGEETKKTEEFDISF